MKAFPAFALAAGVCLLLTQSPAVVAADSPKPQSAPANIARKPTQPAPSWDVRGVVLTEAGTPMARAKVTLRNYQLGRSVETAADGTFLLTVSEKLPFFGLIDAKDQTGRLWGCAQFDRRPRSQGAPLRLVLKTTREMAVSISDKAGKAVQRALVGVDSEFVIVDRQETDAAGKALLRFPADLPLQNVFALKAGVGIDYVDYTQARRGGGKPDAGPTEKNNHLKLVLTEVRTVTVHVTDRDGKPVVGARVNPWYFTLPKAGDFNLPGGEPFVQLTDPQGNASFPFIPVTNKTKIVFWARMTDYVVQDRPAFDPKSKSGDVRAVLLPLEPVRGKVSMVDGHPAAGAEVETSGTGYEIDDFHETAMCDAHGEFELRVAPNKYYTFAARQDRNRSTCESRIVRVGVAVEPVTLVLRPATRVHGRVTRAKDKSPSSQRTITLERLSENDYYKLPEDKRLPNPKKSRRGIGSISTQSAETDADGHFEFLVAPGKYRMWWGEQSPQFEVKDEKPVVVDLVDRRPEQVSLKGRVVLKSDSTRGVGGAIIEGDSTDEKSGYIQPFQVVADHDGRFETSRSEVNMLVWARSGSLAGTVTIKPGDKTVVVPIGPTASVTGILMDQATGQPAANRQIDFSVKLPAGGRSFSWSFGQSGKTDATGRFTIKNLTVGLKYDAHVGMEPTDEGPSFWHTVSVVTPQKAEQMDLGELDLPAPYRPPTLEKLISKAMDVKKPLDARLKDDCYEAKLFEDYVLILAASPKDAACRRFFSILNRRDTRDGDDVARDTLDNFRLLALDVSTAQPGAELKTLLARSDAPSLKGDDPAFVVVDTEGHLVAATTAKQMWPGKTMDAQPLTAFLKQHLPPMPDAQKRLANALAQARRENKHVLVEQSAAWCGWCHVLAKYLDKHRSLVEKDYVWITVDPRFAHGAAVIKQLRPRAQGGIPWMVILDADGKPLITSDGPEGNIGYPGEPSGVEHFEKMLRTTARHMSDAEIKILLADMRKK